LQRHRSLLKELAAQVLSVTPTFQPLAAEINRVSTAAQSAQGRNAMSKYYTRPSLAFFSLLALGAAAPLSAGEQDFKSIEVERLRLVKGTQGCGFGSVVMPTSQETGQLSANLYADSGRPDYLLDGDLSLFIPILPFGRMQFGGFKGVIREASSTGGAHPAVVGFVEGTWTMDGQGLGTLNATSYELTANDVWMPNGAISGEFEVMHLGIPDVAPSQLGRVQRHRPVRDASDGQVGSSIPSSALQYCYLRERRKQMEAAQLSAEFQTRLMEARKLTDMANFGRPAQGLERRIAMARAQTRASKERVESKRSASGLNSVPVEPHLVGKILVKYKIAN